MIHVVIMHVVALCAAHPQHTFHGIGKHRLIFLSVCEIVIIMSVGFVYVCCAGCGITHLLIAMPAA